MFRHLHVGIIRLLREHISLNLIELQDMSGDITKLLRQQHNAIWDAIRRSRPDAAREKMLAHIDFTWTELARRKR